AHFAAQRPWYSYHEHFNESAAAIVGASPGEVVVMNALTVNLHLMMVSFYRPTAERFHIMYDEPCFPSDRYAMASQAAFHGYPGALLALRPRDGEDTLRQDDVLDALERRGRQTALVMLAGVNYLTGQALDIRRITEAAHRQGCVVGFDLAHAAGNLALSLHDDGVDFAAWCSYKYLNGGPGAAGACFVHERHGQALDLPRFAGWWGNDPATRFEMRDTFVPHPGAAGWQLSNAPVLSMAPCRVSYDMFAKVGMHALREKSLKLTGYLMERLNALPAGHFRVVTPRDPHQRGCQISLRFKDGDEARAVSDALDAHGVISDFRKPDVVRVAPVPLYNTFTDVARFVGVLEEVLSR
ncbi:MAG: kynureninase, partial [Armatimonadetes bacterium]|nr:kynureninase [Armatimonadota bacterium]